MSQERAFKTSAMTDVNRHILDAARESISYEEEWEFFCECGRDDCQERIKLTLDAYVALYDSGRAILAEGHQLSRSNAPDGNATMPRRFAARPSISSGV